MQNDVIFGNNPELATAILSCIGDGVIATDLNGRIIYINQIAEEIVDCTAENAVGKEFKEIFKVYQAETEERRECPVDYVLKNNIKTGLKNNSILLKNNITKYVSATCTSINSADGSIMGAVVVFRDITTIRTAELNHLKEEKHLNNILSQLPFIVWMADEQFNWKYINKPYEEITGAAICDTPLEHWLNRTHPEDAAGFKKSALKALRQKTMFIREVRFRQTNNEYRWFMLVGAPYYEQDGQLKGYIGSAYDISLQKEAEADLKRYQKMLITAKDAAEAANRAKSEFLANMSHEIRTPINGIVGMIDLTLLSQMTEEQKDNLLTAKACANSLLRIVNDILDFSKMEADMMILESVNFNLKELIEEIVRTHSPRVEAKGLEFNYTFSSEFPGFLIGDPNRLRQVLNNLISNAVKFTQHGKVTIDVKCLDRTRNEVELKFTVSDTGIGIAKEDMKRLFHSFSQIESTYTKKYGGTGLGLVISKQLVEKMGGTIEARSEEGKGSSFSFNIKFKVGNASLSEEQKLPDLSRALKQLHILLVEDDLVNQKVALRILHEMGHISDTAGNGIDALKLYKNHKYDVILMDIQMPEMNGIETTQKIRYMEQGKHHTPIVAMTAYALPGDKEKFLSLGMNDYIPKPIQMEELFCILEKVTKEKNLNIPESINIAENGEVVYTFDKSVYFTGKNTRILEMVGKSILLLSEKAEQCDFTKLEIIANEIKNISNSMNAIKIKDAAFKLEMAARSENKSEILSCIEQIKYEFKLYHTSNRMDRRG